MLCPLNILRLSDFSNVACGCVVCVVVMYFIMAATVDVCLYNKIWQGNACTLM